MEGAGVLQAEVLHQSLVGCWIFSVFTLYCKIALPLARTTAVL